MFPRRVESFPPPTLIDEDDADEGHLSTEKVSLNLQQCLSSMDYWLLAVAVSVLTGTGLAFINNVGAIVAKLGGQSGTTVRAFGHNDLIRSSVAALFTVNAFARQSGLSTSVASARYMTYSSMEEMCG
jgi:hypothetical protein